LNAFEELIRWDFRPILPEIAVQIKCIIAGESRDALLPTPEVKSGFEDIFETKYIENVAHFLFLERPEEFSKVLEEVLDGFKQ